MKGWSAPEAGPHPARAILTWAAINVVLGYGASFPLVTAVIFSYYVRARVLGTVSAPYHRLEAEVSVAIIVVLGGLLW